MKSVVRGAISGDTGPFGRHVELHSWSTFASSETIKCNLFVGFARSPLKPSPVKQQFCSPSKRRAARQLFPELTATQQGSSNSADSVTVQKASESHPSRCNTVGRLHLIMGPMFAGKTTMLLQKINEAKHMQLRVAVITSALDSRYLKNMCVTHTGMSHEALPAEELLPLSQPGTNKHGWDMNLYDVIAIDESQFFPDLKKFCLHAVEERGKTVIAAGLPGDFERKLFGEIISLVPFADSVDFLNARCSFCEMPAAFTLRIVSNDQQALVGGKDAYQPVCRHHYRLLHHVRNDFVP